MINYNYLKEGKEPEMEGYLIHEYLFISTVHDHIMQLLT